MARHLSDIFSLPLSHYLKTFSGKTLESFFYIAAKMLQDGLDCFAGSRIAYKGRRIKSIFQGFSPVGKSDKPIYRLLMEGPTRYDQFILNHSLFSTTHYSPLAWRSEFLTRLERNRNPLHGLTHRFNIETWPRRSPEFKLRFVACEICIFLHKLGMDVSMLGIEVVESLHVALTR